MEVVELPKKFCMDCYEIMDGKNKACCMLGFVRDVVDAHHLRS